MRIINKLQIKILEFEAKHNRPPKMVYLNEPNWQKLIVEVPAEQMLNLVDKYEFVVSPNNNRFSLEVA